MLPDLDDPRTLPAATPQLREAVRLRGTRLRRRRHALQSAVPAGLALAAVALFATLNSPVADSAPDPAQPVGPSPVVVDGVPVWYDAEGLHRGDVVEQTPVEIWRLEGEDISGALALVKSGALYLDPATRDVWFHPWGGDPRIVGQNSGSGPGGDPSGDTAAWFEGFELVVYDTAAGREISRTEETRALAYCASMCAEHYASGNTFLQISAERVVWNTGPVENAVSYDVRTRKTSRVAAPVVDVHNDVAVHGDTSGDQALVLRTPGRADTSFPEMELRARLSPSGNYVLAVEDSHAAAIVDTKTGELWRVPNYVYPWIAWSYGDIALVDNEDELLACDAATKRCESVPAKRPFLMPTN